MKKIFSIISAGLVALAAFSCVNEDLATFDSSNATAPVLGSYEIGEKAITATYTPGSFKMGFNEKMPVNHSLALVSVNGKTVSKTLTSTAKDGQVSVTITNLAKALIALGCSEGSTASVELAVRASMQEVARDNGRNGYVDSQGHISISDFEVVIPVVEGSPYAELTEDSDWSITGSLSAYGIDWDKDLNMWTDGTTHVAAHVTLKADDQFKFRKDQAWSVNMGGEFGSLDSEFEVTQDGPNIVVGADGVYDLWLNTETNMAWVTEAYDPYPDYTETSSWTIIGHIEYYDNDWGKDYPMITDGTNHLALSIVIGAEDQFKFRQDAAWTVNLGGDFGSLGEDFAVSQDGPNIIVGAEGTYDIFVNPSDGTARVEEASGAKVSSIIGAGGGDEPTPTVTGWNIIGLNGDWDNDILATEADGVWTAYVTAEDDTEFKWRKDGGWDENFGGTFVTLGEPFEAIAGGDNIKVSAGFWKVELNTNDATITVSNGQVWSLIGVNGDWNNDIDMTLSDGKWVSPVTKIEGEFKIRENHGWDNNRGGTLVSIGVAFAAVAGGDNISVEAGNYIVTYDPDAETILIEETGWGLVGTINGWGNTADIILKEEGDFLVAKNVAMTADDEIKIRYNQNWDVNRGGRTAVDKAIQAVPGGDNIKPGVAGNYDVWYRPESEVLFVMEAGAELSYWGVVGTINDWSAPDYVMYETEDGKYVSPEITVGASDKVKIRLNENWDVNRGGVFSELGEAFAVEGNGPDITIGRDAVIVVTYDPEAETITFTGEYTGEAPDLPETMYIIGADFGGWSWDSEDVVDMVPVYGKAGQFWSIRYIKAESPFKFCAQKAWSGDFTGLGDDSGYTVDGGNCYVSEDGVYMIYVDTDNKKLCIEKAKVYGIGDCFGGWNEGMEDALFTENDGKLAGKTSAAGEIRLYAASSIATSDWWTREFVFFDGKIAYRGNGGDQDRVSVEAGKTVTLDFNAGTAVVE